jgi:hypothetical protein
MVVLVWFTEWSSSVYKRLKGIFLINWSYNFILVTREVFFALENSNKL